MYFDKNKGTVPLYKIDRAHYNYNMNILVFGPTDIILNIIPSNNGIRAIDEIQI